MSFIRLKKRSYKTTQNYYAYLVDNKWSKYFPRQKVKSYLGRYYRLVRNETNQTNIVINKSKSKEEIIYLLLKTELLNHNFNQIGSFLFMNSDGIYVNLKTYKVLNKQTNKKVCLGLNEGYLCNYTLKKLLTFKLSSKNKKKEGYNLIKRILNAGLKIDPITFLEVFNKFIN